MDVQRCATQEGVPHDGHYFKKREQRRCLGTTSCGRIEHDSHEYEANVEYWCPGLCLCGLRKETHGPGAHK